MEVERKFETVVTSGHENKDQRTSSSTWCGREGSDEAIHGRAARGLWASLHSQPLDPMLFMVLVAWCSQVLVRPGTAVRAQP